MMGMRPPLPPGARPPPSLVMPGQLFGQASPQVPPPLPSHRSVTSAFIPPSPSATPAYPPGPPLAPSQYVMQAPPVATGNIDEQWLLSFLRMEARTAWHAVERERAALAFHLLGHWRRSVATLHSRKVSRERTAAVAAQKLHIATEVQRSADVLAARRDGTSSASASMVGFSGRRWDGDASFAQREYERRLLAVKENATSDLNAKVADAKAEARALRIADFLHLLADAVTQVSRRHLTAAVVSWRAESLTPRSTKARGKVLEYAVGAPSMTTASRADADAVASFSVLSSAGSFRGPTTRIRVATASKMLVRVVRGQQTRLSMLALRNLFQNLLDSGPHAFIDGRDIRQRMAHREHASMISQRLGTPRGELYVSHVPMDPSGSLEYDGSAGLFLRDSRGPSEPHSRFSDSPSMSGAASTSPPHHFPETHSPGGSIAGASRTVSMQRRGGATPLVPKSHDPAAGLSKNDVASQPSTRPPSLGYIPSAGPYG